MMNAGDPTEYLRCKQLLYDRSCIVSDPWPSHSDLFKPKMSTLEPLIFNSMDVPYSPPLQRQVWKQATALQRLLSYGVSDIRDTN